MAVRWLVARYDFPGNIGIRTGDRVNLDDMRVGGIDRGQSIAPANLGRGSVRLTNGTTRWGLCPGQLARSMLEAGT